MTEALGENAASLESVFSDLLESISSRTDDLDEWAEIFIDEAEKRGIDRGEADTFFDTKANEVQDYLTDNKLRGRVEPGPRLSTQEREAKEKQQVTDFYDTQIETLWDEVEAAKDKRGERGRPQFREIIAALEARGDIKLAAILKDSNQGESKVQWAKFYRKKEVDYNLNEDKAVKRFLAQVEVALFDDPKKLAAEYEANTHFKAGSDWFEEKVSARKIEAQAGLEADYEKMVSRVPDRDLAAGMLASFKKAHSFTQRWAWMKEGKDKVGEYARSIDEINRLEPALLKQAETDPELLQKITTQQKEYDKGKRDYTNEQNFYSPNKYLSFLQGLAPQAKAATEKVEARKTTITRIEAKTLANDVPKDLPRKKLSYDEFYAELKRRNFYDIPEELRQDAPTRDAARAKTKQLHTDWLEARSGHLTAEREKNMSEALSKIQAAQLPSNLADNLNQKQFEEALGKDFFKVDPKIWPLVQKEGMAKAKALFAEYQAQQAEKAKRDLKVKEPEVPVVTPEVAVVEAAETKDAIQRAKKINKSMDEFTRQAERRGQVFDDFKHFEQMFLKVYPDFKSDLVDNKTYRQQLEKRWQPLEQRALKAVQAEKKAEVQADKDFRKDVAQFAKASQKADAPYADAAAFTKAFLQRHPHQKEAFKTHPEYADLLAAQWGRLNTAAPGLAVTTEKQETNVNAARQFIKGTRMTPQLHQQIGVKLKDKDASDPDVFARAVRDLGVYQGVDPSLWDNTELRELAWQQNVKLQQAYLQPDTQAPATAEEEALNAGRDRLPNHYELDWDGLDQRLKPEQQARALARFNQMHQRTESGLQTLMQHFHKPLGSFVLETLAVMTQSQFDRLNTALKPVKLESNNRQQASEWLQTFCGVMGLSFLEKEAVVGVNQLRKDYQTYFGTSFKAAYQEYQTEEEDPEMTQEDEVPLEIDDVKTEPLDAEETDATTGPPTDDAAADEVVVPSETELDPEAVKMDDGEPEPVESPEAKAALDENLETLTEPVEAVIDGEEAVTKPPSETIDEVIDQGEEEPLEVPNNEAEEAEPENFDETPEDDEIKTEGLQALENSDEDTDAAATETESDIDDDQALEGDDESQAEDGELAEPKLEGEEDRDDQEALEAGAVETADDEATKLETSDEETSAAEVDAALTEASEAPADKVPTVLDQAEETAELPTEPEAAENSDEAPTQTRLKVEGQAETDEVEAGLTAMTADVLPIAETPENQETLPLKLEALETAPVLPSAIQRLLRQQQAPLQQRTSMVRQRVQSDVLADLTLSELMAENEEAALRDNDVSQELLRTHIRSHYALQPTQPHFYTQWFQEVHFKGDYENLETLLEKIISYADIALEITVGLSLRPNLRAREVQGDSAREVFTSIVWHLHQNPHYQSIQLTADKQQITLRCDESEYNYGYVVEGLAHSA